MDEITTSVAAKIVGYLVAPVGLPFIYLWNYKTNLENLKNEVEKLKAMKRSVDRLIRAGEETLPHVEIWQKSVDQIIPEAELSREDNPEQENIQCCIGFSFLNLINRYQSSKNAAKKLKDVLKLEQEAAPWLAQISSRTNIPDDPWLRSGDGYEAFDSRSSVLKNIIYALRDPDVNMVGIYGMGGIGKTTLARKVAKHIQQDNPAHVIVFVEVSITPNIKNIQQAIGGKLGLKFHDETEDGQARELYEELKKEVTVSDNSGEKKKEKKILLILDNIWGKIDLEKVGIPLGGDCKGLKLLLTTRSIHLLTNQMNSHCNFLVETLEEAEALSLFKSTAGMCVDHPDLKNIAPKVAKECGNMPLAIVTIASALKDKEESTWSAALNELKNPSLEGFEETMTREVYTCIKFSYDHLETKEIKEIFLLCSRMGCTYDASIQDLFMYGLGLGFFKRFKTLEEAQCKVEDLVKKLKGNSLLLDAPNETRESLRHVIPDGERFAMHDVICDVARSIDRQKGNVCNVIDDAISCRWAKMNILKNCTSITLHNISEVPKDLRLELPQLEFFYMKTKNSFSKIVDDFFIEMPSLLVLHLIEMNLSPLPTSFSHLVNLQTLCLDKCELGDIVDIGKLEKLEILSFCGSKIEKLPEEMRQLTSIRLLDLTGCSTLEIILPDVLSCFTQLEALYMYGTLIRWEDGGHSIVGRNASLNELKHLCDRLTTLEICIPNVKMSEGLLSPQLKRYKISIYRSEWKWPLKNCSIEWKWPPKNSRTLRVQLNTNDNADEVISQLKGIKQLELCAGLEDDFTKQSVSLDALSSLESLSLQDLYFEKICNVPLAAESFCQLRTITVDSCDKLTNIFSFSIDRVLPKLQEIRVLYCKNMEGIFAIEREDDVNNTELIHEIKFSQLCSVTLKGLPQLKSFCHRVKTTSQLQLTSSTNDGEIISEDTIDIPKSLFNEKVVFPNLETLNISNISAEKIWHNQLPTISSSSQNLNRLEVSECNNLKELFSSSMVNSFVQLQYLGIGYCSLLEEMVFMEELKEEERKDTQFPSLKEMTIISCPNFKRFISNDKIGFPSLKAMDIRRCHKFKESIFNDKVVFPNLETLYISDMPVEKIWHNQLPTMSSSFQNLNRLNVRDCDNLKELFSSSMVNSFVQLQYLKIFRCSLLEGMVFMEELKEEERNDTQFPLLKEMAIQFCLNFKGLISNDKGFISNDKIGFPSLKAMEITGSHKFKESIFNDKVAVTNIEKLTISYMNNLEKIWHDQLVKDSFFKLKSLGVYGCKKLLNVFPSNIYGRLLSLESLYVSECDSLKEIFDLRELSTCDTRIMLSFESLQRLQVSRCFSLKNLFSASILVKEGVVMEEAPARFLFPKLTSLKLDVVPELRSFYPGRHRVEGFVLKALHLVRCDKDDEDDEEEGDDTGEVDEDDDDTGEDDGEGDDTGKVDEDDDDTVEDDEEGDDTGKVDEDDDDTDEDDEEGQMQQPFFLSLAFPCLEELTLDGEQVTMLCQGQFLESDLFDRLKILKVWFDKSIVFPFGIIQRCQNLEELLLFRSHYKEIFPHGEDQTQTKIKTLNLSYLKDLKYIWKQNSKLDLIFQHLEVLNVQSCHGLISLMQPPTSFQNPSTSFQNLTSLKVEYCNSLINIGTSTVVKSLVQLTEMSISSCKKITEVIGNHGDVIEDEIIFRKLKSLELRYLPSLTSFCSWNCTLNFPSLETLTVQRCPNMKIFSQGDLTTEKLQIVTIGWESVELHSDFNLNTAIQQSYEKVNASRKPISAKDNGASSSHHPVLMAGPAVVPE